MTGAFIVNRRAAIFRVLLCLAITFTLGFAAGRVSAAPKSAPAAMPAAPSGETSGDLPALSGALDLRPGTNGGERLRWLANESQGGSVKAVQRSVSRNGKRPVSEQPRTATLLRGTASWYSARGLIAAVHSWRWGNRPYTVRVCAARCISVLVQDYCAGCIGSRLIDLSDDAFRLLAPLGQGIVKVSVRR